MDFTFNLEGFGGGFGRPWGIRDCENKASKLKLHKIAIFNTGLIDIAEKYIKKGMKVYLEGQLQTKKWQDYL